MAIYLIADDVIRKAGAEAVRFAAYANGSAEWSGTSVPLRSGIG